MLLRVSLYTAIGRSMLASKIGRASAGSGPSSGEILQLLHASKSRSRDLLVRLQAPRPRLGPSMTVIAMYCAVPGTDFKVKPRAL